MIGPKGMAFDNDDVLDDNVDEDLQNDPISQIDMQVSFASPCSLQLALIPEFRLIFYPFSANVQAATSAISPLLLTK
jgi:hypothetical protein